MGATSNLLRFEQLDPSSLQADEPCSVYRAWSTFNNLAHLVDASAQHRINHQVASDEDTYLTSHPMDTFWEQQFTHSWLKPIIPANLDVLIALKVQSGTIADVTFDPYTLHVYAEIVPVTSTSIPPILWSTELDVDTVDYATATDAIDERILFDANTVGIWSELNATIPILDAGVVTFPVLFMSKLRIKFSSSDAGAEEIFAGVQLSRVLVREFA